MATVPIGVSEKCCVGRSLPCRHYIEASQTINESNKVRLPFLRPVRPILKPPTDSVSLFQLPWSEKEERPVITSNKMFA